MSWTLIPSSSGGDGDPTMGGDLTGPASAAEIAAGSIVNADVNGAAAIAHSKMESDARARANHTGTQLAATVSDFGATVNGTAVGGDLSGTVNNALLATGALGYITGGWYAPSIGGSNSTSALTLDRAHYALFVVPKAATFDRIGIEVTTAAASAVVRLGIYNAAGGVPTSVLLDAGTVDASSTGAKEITISQALPRGVYFLAAVVQTASGVAVRTKVDYAIGLFHFSVVLPSTTQVAGLFQNTMSGALASYTNGTSGVIDYTPKVMLRAA